MAYKTKYGIFWINESEICTPDTDFYSRQGDWNSTSTTMLTPTGDVHDTVDEAEGFLSDPQNGYSGNFVILKIYKVG